jgi:hypothetical protein
MWDFIKHKLAKLGCFFVIALIMIGATALTKVVLGWFHYDETQKVTISDFVGDYIGKGLLGLLVLLGFIMMGRQLVAELRGKRAQPPVIAPPLIPPPIRRDIRDFTRETNENRDA